MSILCVACYFLLLPALQHGKDFGRILQFMQTKHKKKHQDAFIGNLNRNQVSTCPPKLLSSQLDGISCSLICLLSCGVVGEVLLLSNMAQS